MRREFTRSRNSRSESLSLGRMLRRTIMGMAILLLTTPVGEVVGQQTGGGASGTGRWVERCAAGSEDAEQATEALAVVARQVQASTTEADLSALHGALDRLHQMTCFQAFAEWIYSNEHLHFGNLAQLMAWWEEGGHYWLRDLAAGTNRGEARMVVFPPDPREVLIPPQWPADYVLRSLACPHGDPVCGRETEGWALRAESAFRHHALREREPRPQGPNRGQAGATEPECMSEVRAARPRRRYVEWLDCVGNASPRVAALPAGRIRAPLTGVLVIRGRRGHYSFCDEQRKYDLATGAARVTSSCGSLVLRQGGSVDGSATRATRRGSERSGWISVDAIREVAWMLLLAERVDESHALTATVELPQGIVQRFRTDAPRSWSLGWSSGWTSGQTTLGWAWVDGDRTLAEGRLTWPESSAAADSHAAELLRVAEAKISFERPPSR